MRGRRERGGRAPTITSARGRHTTMITSRTKVAAPRNVYECSDGKYLALSASMQSMWEKVAHAIDRPELIEDPRYKTSKDRVDNIVSLDEIVGGYIASRTLDENLAYFDEMGITVGPICCLADLIDNAFIRSCGVI